MKQPLTVTATATAIATASTDAPAGAPTQAAAGDCAVNPSSAPLTAVEPYGTVPQEGRISLTLTGIPSGSLSPGVPDEVNLACTANLPFTVVG